MGSERQQVAARQIAVKLPGKHCTYIDTCFNPSVVTRVAVKASHNFKQVGTTPPSSSLLGLASLVALYRLQAASDCSTRQ